MKIVQVKCTTCTLLNYVDVSLTHIDNGESDNFAHKCTFCGKSIDDILEEALNDKNTFIIKIDGVRKFAN